MEKQPPPSERGETESFDLRGSLRLLFTYKWLIVGAALVTGVVVLAWTVRQPRIYEASCSIQYDPNPPRPLGSGVEDVADPVGSFWMNREFFETQNRIIRSRSLAERVVRLFGLHEDPGFHGIPQDRRASWAGATVEDTALVLQSRLSVEPEERTRIVVLRVRDTDRERAARLANAVADAYIERTIEERLSSTVSALEWLGEQLDTLRQQLAASELALHDFNSTMAVSIDDRQAIVSAQIQHFDRALTEARTSRIEMAARLSRLRALLQEPDVDSQAAALAEVETVGTLRQELRAALAEREGLVVRYGPAHPRMVELDARIQEFRAQVGTEISAVLRAAEADLAQVQATERGLRTALDEAQAAGLELNLREIEYERLNRERENKAKLYNLVLQRSTETDLTRMLRITHVSVVDSALVPSRHVSPNLPLNAAGGLLAGLVLGIGLAFGHSRLDRRIRRPGDVEQYGVPILGALPVLPGATLRTGARRRGRRRPVHEAGDTIAHTQPMSGFAENCRSIRTNLTFMGAERPLRTIVVTSSGPEEGKTTVATNLSISIAQSGRRVLIVDTDLRRPRVHLAFGVSSSRGVTSVVSGASTLEDCISPTDVPNVFVLPSGPIPPNPAELLHHRRFAEIIEHAASLYDVVVFDSPPLSVVTDAAIVAPQVDGVLFVVRAQTTTRDAVQSVTRQIRTVGAHLVGAVMNGIDAKRERYGYSAEGYYALDGRAYYTSDRAERPGE